MSDVLEAVYRGDRDEAEQLAAGRELDVFEAAALGRTERLRQLLDEDASRVKAFGADGFHPLGLACFFGHVDAAQLLLDRGADVNATAADGRTALHGAALQGYDDVIKFLASHGADLNAQDRKGFTPLDTALGKAGGFGFAGQEGVVREGTAAVLRSLMGANATPAAANRQGLTETAVAAQH